MELVKEVTIERFNRLHWAVRLTFLTLLAVAFAVYGFPRIAHTGWAVVMKLSGNAPHCPWSRVFAYYENLIDFGDQEIMNSSKATLLEYDNSLGIGRVSVPLGNFWEKDVLSSWCLERTAEFPITLPNRNGCFGTIRNKG